MMVGTLIQQVFSDSDFPRDAQCVHCEAPTRREEVGQRIHPALAIATDDSGYDLAAAVVLCSACLDSEGIDACQLEAMGRASDLDGLHYRYQLVGDEDGRESLEEFIGTIF